MIRHWQQGVASGKWQNEPGLDRRQTRILRMVPDARRDEARTILTENPAELFGFDIDALQPIANRVCPTAEDLVGAT